MENIMSVPLGYVAVPLNEYEALVKTAYTVSIPVGHVLIHRNEYKMMIEEACMARKEVETIPDQDEKLKAASERLAIEIMAKPTVELPNVNEEEKSEPKPSNKKISDNLITRINHLRTMNMSIPDIAKKCSVSETTVRKYLAEYSEQHTSVIKKFAKSATPLADTGVYHPPV